MKHLYVLIIAAVLAPGLMAQTSYSIDPKPKPNDLAMNGGPVTIAWPESDTFVTCAVTIVAPLEKIDRRKPVLLVLAIDVSRPMQGEVLKYVKKAARGVVEMLNDGDVLGVVAFSTYARVAFPMQPLTAGVRTNAHNAINGLGDEDKRNSVEGMQRAAEQFERFKGQDAIGRHIFLITNGDANQGTTDNKAVEKKMIKLVQPYDACISTFGFKYFDRTGEDFNEELLENIARRTRGRYYFIDDVQDMASRLSEEANRICNATARKVKLRISTPGRASRITNVEGGYTEKGVIVVGDMAPGAMRMVLFDIEGRPSRQRDCEVVATYLEGDRLGEREERIYLDIPLTGGSTRLNPNTAPRIIVYDLQASLAETSEEILKNRKEYTLVFRDKIVELEQENVILDSDYVRDALKYYKQFDRVLDNSSVEHSVVIKHIKYRQQRLLLGK
jgi:Mg-chelatase subunit ChlD